MITQSNIFSSVLLKTLLKHRHQVLCSENIHEIVHPVVYSNVLVSKNIFPEKEGVMPLSDHTSVHGCSENIALSLCVFQKSVCHSVIEYCCFVFG